MKFDFSEVLTRAAQVTWKHKILWLFSALPSLTAFFAILLFFLPFLFPFDRYGRPRFVEEPLFFLLVFAAIIFIILLGAVLYGLSSAIVNWGVLRVESGEQRLDVRTLFQGGQKYWLNTLGVVFLTIVITSFAMAVIAVVGLLVGIVTLGIGFLCLAPLSILTYPLSLVFQAFSEEALVAVVADDLDVIAAIRRSWELVKTNFWHILLVSLIVYLGLSLLVALFITLPVTVSSYVIAFFVRDVSDMRIRMLLFGGASLFIFPLMALVQGIGITFIKATYAIIYLRLTRPSQADAALFLEANA